MSIPNPEEASLGAQVDGVWLDEGRRLVRGQIESNLHAIKSGYFSLDDLVLAGAGDLVLGLPSFGDDSQVGSDLETTTLEEEMPDVDRDRAETHHRRAISALQDLRNVNAYPALDEQAAIDQVVQDRDELVRYFAYFMPVARDIAARNGFAVGPY